jgi:hypothetical protein
MFVLFLMENTTLYFLLCFTYLTFRLLSKVLSNVYDAYLVKKWKGNLDIFEDHDFIYPIATVRNHNGTKYSDRVYDIHRHQDMFDSYLMFLLDKLNLTTKLVSIVDCCVGYVLHFICCDCAIYRRVFYRVFNTCNSKW